MLSLCHNNAEGRVFVLTDKALTNNWVIHSQEFYKRKPPIRNLFVPNFAHFSYTAIT